MTERLLIAALLVGLTVAVAATIRWFVAMRSAQKAAAAPLLASSSPRLMLFSTAWCGDCQTQKQLIEETRDTWPHPVEISVHDVSHERQLADRYGILTAPALVVAAPDGRIVSVKQGLVDADRLRSLIEAAA